MSRNKTRGHKGKSRKITLFVSEETRKLIEENPYLNLSHMLGVIVKESVDEMKKLRLVK